ncbi:MAG: hypothetical protein IJZ04_02340 [Clostridia bacterium]|nr:hypothetical protein [Clostridia bacterium]
MKKALITVLMMVIFISILTIVCSAKEVTSLDEIKSDIENAQVGDELVFDLKSDVFIPKGSGIVINKNITITINTNGYLIYADVGSGGAGTVYGFKLMSGGAKLIMNGNTTDVDYKNYNAPTDKTITASNGVIVNPNKESGVKSPDFASNGPAIVVYTGSIVLNNMYINQYNSDEWAIVFLSDGQDQARVHNGKFNGCIIKSGGNKYTAIGMRDNGGSLAECKMILEDSVVYGLGQQGGTDSIFSVGPGSYIRNVRFEAYAPTFDSNLSLYMQNENAFKIENAIFTTSTSFKIATGRIHYDFINCTFKENSTMTMSGDNAGKAVVRIINTATCSSAGSMTVYTTPKGGSTTITVDEDYATQNPPVPHSSKLTDCTRDVLCEMCNEAVVYPKQYDSHKTYAVSVKYDNGFASVGKQMVKCENCNAVDNEEDALPLFVAQGYTKSSDDTGFGTGFQINKDALVTYETLNNTKITFGIVVFNPQYLNGETFVDGKINATKGALQVNMTTEYTNCNLLVNGFNETHAGLELVFAGYAYEGTDTSKIQVMQKEYISTEQAPVASPMCSQVNGLYTVKISTVVNPSFVGNKESLDAFVKKS